MTAPLVGIVSLSDALRETNATEAGVELSEISEPGGRHSQSDETYPHLAVAPSDVSADDATWVLHFADDEPT